METSEFFSYSWHIDEKEKNQTCIRIYGLNKKNENVCIIVNNFTPYVYVELPNVVEWDVTKAQMLGTKLDFMMKEHSPLEKRLIMKKKLYGANLDEKFKRRLYPYLMCSFAHQDDIGHLIRISRYPLRLSSIGSFTIKIHEYNASPILQLTSLRKIPTAGWIKFTGNRVCDDDMITRCDHEFIVKWKNLFPIDTNEIAYPLIMGYDIEANSSFVNAMPNADRPPDKIFQISCVFARQGDKPDTYRRHLLTLGSVDFSLLDDNIEVTMFEIESDLLSGFVNIIQKFQPNIIIGYNIFTFDIPYMIARSKLLNCFDFNRQGFDKYGVANEKLIEWNSSAYKNQKFQFLDAEGRLFVDLLPLVRRDYKMSNYRLETIASYFLKGMTKDPLNAKGIFKCYRLGMKSGPKGARALSIVGKYCVKDSELVIRLFETLTTWVALCEMAKVTNVPIFALYTQGQQIKVFSQVYRKCTHENIVVEKDGYITKDDEHYVGATVFPPKAGLYEKVSPFDFSSLYPTTIIAYNICPSTLVTDDAIPDRMCHNMDWWDHQGCEHDPKEIRKAQLNKIIKEKEALLKGVRVERDKSINKYCKEKFADEIKKITDETRPFRKERSDLQKSKPKHIMCAHRNYRWLKEPMGVIPEILTHLLDTRKITKKEMKVQELLLEKMQENDPQYNNVKTYAEVLNQRQLALKVSANSAYGAMGVTRGSLPFMPGAMCTTYMGRLAVQKAAKSIQEDFGGKLIYGDSVVGGTPILIKYQGKVLYRTIDNLPEVLFSENDDKEFYYDPPFEVWSDTGFTKVKKVIRHKTHKKLYRILTHTGLVTVTEDHSLLDPELRVVRPSEIKVGQSLLHHPLPIYEGTTRINCPYAKGLFMAEGSCGTSSWTINNTNLEFINKAKKELEKYFTLHSFRILETMKSYKLVVKEDVHSFVQEWRAMFYDKYKNKIVPDEMYDSHIDDLSVFYRGYYDGNSDAQSDIGSAGLYYILNRLGYDVSLNNREDKLGVTHLTATKGDQEKNPLGIKKIWELPPTYEYVYDLETERHHFSAGIGQLVVHNTDSNYINFPHLNTAKECWEHSEMVSKKVSSLFPKPINLAFEEVIYWKFFILTKKRYMSLACGKDGKISDEIVKKGVLLQRRDNCIFVRRVYEKIIMMVFEKANSDAILFYILNEINNLCSHTYPLKDFVISKSVGDTKDMIPRETKNDKGKLCYKVGDYTIKLSDEEKSYNSEQHFKNIEIYLERLPAQAQLAEKMRRRGQLVAAGSRLEYVITTSGGHKAKQFLKIESSEYFSKHTESLSLDLMYYLKQMTNPFDQVLNIVFQENPPLQDFVTKQYELRLQKMKLMFQISNFTSAKLQFFVNVD